ncbi:MAG: hypothetical protein M1817_004507 [Caeruleum heppii]|nr:MAG: hypothetical protein M1817_004507 [Caeruleum heppii]
MLPPSPTPSFLHDLETRFPSRSKQIAQLSYLLWPSLPTPPTIVIHGLSSTGKSSLTSAILRDLPGPHAIVRSRECITARQLYESTLCACQEALSTDTVTAEAYLGRCESLSSLVAGLRRLFEGRQNRRDESVTADRERGGFTLVFDGVDKQREAPPGLLAALGRLGEMIPGLTIIMIVTSPRPRFLHTTGVPHINFPPYTKAESLAILAINPPTSFESISSSQHSPSRRISPAGSPAPPAFEDADDAAWVWTRFTATVWDSLAKGAARDVMQFRAVCEKLWVPFVKPIVENTYGTRDFAKLVVSKRALFQSEEVLSEGVVPKRAGEAEQTHDLPFYSRYLLCAAYLASFNPARQDPIFFMKASEKKRRRKGGGAVAGRGAKHRKIQRKLLGPQAFVLERMMAIFHAILPDTVIPTADLQTQASIATLASLRLLVRTSTAADVLEMQTKWRVNVSWGYVQTLARSVGFEIENHLAE